MVAVRQILSLSLALSGLVAGVMGGCGGGNNGTGGTGGTGGTTTSTSSSATTGGGGGSGGALAPTGTNVSSSLALTTDDMTLWIVNQDSDSVSVIDTQKGALLDEILLGEAPPSMNTTTMRYDPAVLPRALAIVGDAKVYVAGESANTVYVLDATSHQITAKIPVPAAPVSVAAAPDGSAVYVVCHEAAVLIRIDPHTDKVTGSLSLSQHPWGVSVSADGASVFVTHILLDPGVSVVDASTFTLDPPEQPDASQGPGPLPTTALAPQPVSSLGDQIPSGLVRGAFAAVPNPVGGELWVPHMLLATGTAEPALAFNTTAFPTVTTLTADGSAMARRLLFQPNVAGAVGNFTDSCSGPRAVAFTPDGKLALLALAQSEDVMVFNTTTGDEVGLVQPLPSTLLEGIVVDHAGTSAYVDGRNTHDVTVLSIDETNSLVPVIVSGTGSIDRIMTDPMPAPMRHGQRLFNTANSAAVPITQNFWMSCATCHIEGGSDAVTWQFVQGPRDTPSNAGGPINTGFLLRQAIRSKVEQYDETIDFEMGGDYHLAMASQDTDLADLALYVNYCIPFPQNPNLAPGGVLTASQMRGQTLFDINCSTCHTGPYLTDSGQGNPTLDLSGPIALHDIGTCVTTGTYQDMPAYSALLDPYWPATTSTSPPDRTACMFDTPTLRGIFATPPYFHDGSAPTLAAAVSRVPAASGLSAEQQADLVSYLMTL
jgi:YVTN family beta-propeller protein